MVILMCDSVLFHAQRPESGRGRWAWVRCFLFAWREWNEVWHEATFIPKTFLLQLHFLATLEKGPINATFFILHSLHLQLVDPVAS